MTNLSMYPDYTVLNAQELRGQIIQPDDSIKIDVSFRPTSERVPYGACVVKDSFFVNFNTQDGIPNLTK
jgi:hypothetical protein